jgi:4-amino-4-deoxy-L-arabinose transferase-like glycosyltransferase
MSAQGVRRTLATHAVLVVVLLAAGVRIGYVAFAKRGPCNIEFQGHVVGQYHSECTGAGQGKANDQVYYNAAANQLADGKGFIDAFHPGVETADHPPLTAFVLAGVAFAFDHFPLSTLADSTHTAFGTVAHNHVREERYFMALLGTLNVFLILVLARRIAGCTVGLVAGLFAAFYPFLWVNDGLLFSETVAITCVVLTLLAACWCAERPSALRFALVGALCALAALARAELLLLAPLLLLAIAWWMRSAGAAKVIAALGAGVLGSIVVLAPWFAYNASRFHDRVLISTNDGLALAGSNCDLVYHGKNIGLWVIVPPCVYTDAELARLDAQHFARTHQHLDQSDISTLYRHKATTYIKDHLSRLPIVVAARVGRVWNVYRPLDMISYNEGENRERWVTELGLVAYYPLMLFAIAGSVALVKNKQGRFFWILLVPAISATAVAAATYGQTRLRATAEPSLVILAAVGACWALDRWRARSSDTTAATPEAAVPRL